MPQQQTQEQAAVAQLMAAIDNLNAAWDRVHRMGLVAQCQSPAVEVTGTDGKKFTTIRTQAKVFRPLN